MHLMLQILSCHLLVSLRFITICRLHILQVHGKRVRCCTDFLSRTSRRLKHNLFWQMYDSFASLGFENKAV